MGVALYAEGGDEADVGLGGFAEGVGCAAADGNHRWRHDGWVHGYWGVRVRVWVVDWFTAAEE